MQILFQDYREAMESLEENGNSVIFSSLKNFYKPVDCKGFSLKYVAEGAEKYNLSDTQFNITAGSYLLCNSTKKGYVEVDSKKMVKGICVNISTDVMLDVVASICCPGTAVPDRELAGFFTSPLFLENKYSVKETSTGKQLENIWKHIEQKQFYQQEINIGFYYSLCEKIIKDQIPVFRQLRQIPSVKQVTKRDLFRRAARGKEFIDHSFSAAITIEQVAKEAYMSEYHFFRVFKVLYGQSPYQYILKKRLEFARKILKNRNLPLAVVALECGFQDAYYFSKAFKKHFGFSPVFYTK